MLSSRLKLLDRNLERIVQVCDWRKRELEFTAYPVDGDVWNRAFRSVRARAQVIQEGIHNLRTDFAEGRKDSAGAWKQYKHMHREASDVGRACIELMGGFVLRDHMPEGGGLLDRRLCLFTEELAQRCNELTDPNLNPPPAIPALQDPLAETMTRVIRLRFPDWDLWALPLVAYEYAKVVFDDVQQLKQAISDEVDRRRQDDPSLDPEGLQRSIETLMADVFGTYVMGPAYVCAAVLLRLEPPGADGSEHELDLERAETMFAATRKLYKEEAPAVFIRESVEKIWAEACDPVGPGVALEAIRDRADRFAARALRTVQQTTYAEAEFATYADVGEHWNRAASLSDCWRAELKDEPTQSAPGTVDLREVLNAAWRSRLQSPPSDAADFARRARDACANVIDTSGAGPQALTSPKGVGLATSKAGR